MKKVFYGLAILILLLFAGWLIVGLSLQEAGAPAENPSDNASGFVIETEVDGPEDCTKLEQYDAERNVCFIECESEEECDAKEAELDAELEKMDFSAGNKSLEADKLKAEDSEGQALIDNALAVYSIEKGEKYKLLRGKDNTEAQKIRTLVQKILPANISDKNVNRLILMYHKDKDGLAFVTPTRAGDTSKWDIFVNMNSGSDEKELVATLVHEFGHILFLNNDALKQTEMCDGYTVDEGCADNSTILGKFYSRFWEGKFDPEAGAEENFMKEQTAFVNDYAATNPTEDLAETFANFVLKPKPSNTQYVMDQKILFFYEFPELVKLRSQIRRELARAFK